MAEDYPVRVVRVIDGDSVVVRLPDGGEQSVRMYGIDAPELKQRHGDLARRYLERVVRSHREWRLEVVDRDRYQRLVGLLYPAEGSPRHSANHVMVEEGLAYWFKEYGGAEYGFDAAERRARMERAGVWSDEQSMRPWDYRRAARGGRKAGESGWMALLKLLEMMAQIFAALAAMGETSGGSRRSSNPFKPKRRRRKKLF